MSIFLRYNSVPVVLSRPYETADSRDDNGDLKILNFPNEWGDGLTSFASSGFILLAAENGVIINTPGFVDASGYRANSVFAQNYYRIDSNGGPIDFFLGNTNRITYKVSSSEIGTVDDFVYNSGIGGKLTYPNGPAGSPLHLRYSSDKLDGSNSTKEITTYEHIVFKPQITIPPENPDDDPVIYPPLVTISGTDLFVEKIQIGDGGEDFKGAILTHNGSGEAIWLQNEYLEADGMTWNRYPKRAVMLRKGKIIFYKSPPAWAILSDPDDYADFTKDTLIEEFGPNDTIAILTKTEDGFDFVPRFVKPAVDIFFVPEDTTPSMDYGDLFTTIDFVEPSGTVTLQGFELQACGATEGDGQNALPDQDGDIYVRYGYAFSVTKGAYLSMSIASGATSMLQCGNTTPNPGFKPSTRNHISIRPDIHTSFNTLAENIDFVIYGKHKTEFNKYVPELFDVDESLLPQGLIPGFKLDANIPNAVSGNPNFGVIFDQYIDRLKTIPTGYILDDTPKVLINRTQPHVIDSIASGLGFLDYYANFSVSGATYSDQIIAEDIYLLPKPDPDGTGKYVANAVLTIDNNGKIISRAPTPNPTIPGKPTNIEILIAGNNECSLFWSAGNDGGRAVVNYIIEFSANQGNTWTEVPDAQILKATNTQTSCTITGLQTSIPYLFRVIAQNSVGFSDPSEPSTEFIANYDLPESPRSFSVNRTFGDELSIIDLSWNEPDSFGSTPISGYIIEESDNNGDNWIYHNTVNSLISNTYEIIYGLQNEVNYLYRISAINASGQGTYNFVYASGNIPPVIEEDPDVQVVEEETISNFDFGVVLFTGVCQS